MENIILSWRKQVEKQGSMVALHDPRTGIALTYGELDENARRIAARLKSDGVEKGDTVIITASRSAGYIEAVFGVLMAGGAYVPLSDHYPESRVKYIADDCGAKVRLDDEYIRLAAEVAPLSEAENILPEDRALIAYTSGSTGKPKGIVHTHIGIARAIERWNKLVAYSPEDVYGIDGSFNFIVHVYDIFACLTSGIPAVLVPEDLRGDPAELADFIDKHKISIVVIAPKVLKYFTRQGESLRLVITVGERLTGVCGEGFQILEMYGTTETLGLATYFWVDMKYDNTPIGQSASDVAVYLLDEKGQLGDEGEICVAGEVGHGYLNLAEQTAKTFVPNPFKEQDGFAVLVHTGDLGRRLPDGKIEYVNRKDWMVKINGQRVEPGEIEEELRGIEGITDAAVRDFTDSTGEVFLAAYYTAETSKGEDELRKTLARVLPSYMVPAYFLRLDKMPLNASGKLDRQALAKPEVTHPVRPIDPPQNEEQAKVLAAVAEIVEHKNFGISDDLFAIGLSSIGVIRLTVNLAEIFSVPVTVGEIRKNPTVSELAQLLAAKEPQADYDILTDYPLSQTQKGILVESLAHPDTTIYHLPTLFRLSPKVDIMRLKMAVEETIGAHPYLKARLFATEEGNYRVRRDDEAPVTVEIMQVDELPAQLAVPFDFAGGFLFRAEIYVTGKDNYLFLDFHHIIFDGTSCRILLDDINAAYAGESLEKESYTGYEWALDEEQLRGTGEYDEAKDYWEKLLADAQRGMLPEGIVHKAGEGKHLDVMADSLDLAAIKEFCRVHELTESAFFNAAFAFVLSRYEYSDEAIYTTLWNSRKDSRLQRAVVMLVKTFPALAKIDGAAKVSDFIRGMGRQLGESMAHDLYSFAEICTSLGIRADMFLTYQGDYLDFHTVGGEEAELCPVAVDTIKAPLDVEVTVKKGMVNISCEYEQQRYSENFVRGFISCLIQAAREFLSKENVKDISLLDEAAKARVESFNATDYPVELKHVHGLFEEQVRRHPDKVAVIAGNDSLTYAQLNERANMIANALVSRGLAKEEIVGMIMPRTVDAMAVEYGILKAGGAFLPMLPDYPDDRIDYCLTDAKCRFVITPESFMEERQMLFAERPYHGLTIESLYGENNCQNPKLDISADSLAYAIYTSGSTGKPKGVMITHGNLCNFLHANEKNEECRNYVSYGRVGLSVASLSFDFSIMELHLPLTHGLTLCIASEDEITNPLLLAETIRKHQVDIIAGTPSFLGSLLAIPEAAEALRNVKMYDTGAEAFPPALYKNLRAASPEAVIVNGYGPTEATISCISKVVESGENITIGRPAANVKAWIIDRAGHLLPPGARGELCIGGLGVGRGYIGLPEKNAAAFISLQGQRAYRTGDLARLADNGEIEFFGRLDNQVKLRGLRIELDEIENVIASYPGIDRCIVLVWDKEAGDPFLCAWFTANKEIGLAELKAYVAKSLAKYMIPSVFMQLEFVPMTSNGKVDKKALPAPVRQQTEEIIPPQNERQQRIFDLAVEVLGHKEFGIATDLYETGLSSLGAIRLNVLLSKAFEVPVTTRDLRDNSTVAALETFLSAREPLENYALLPDYPLTKNQEGVLVECMENPHTTMYNIPILFKLSPRVEIPRLKTALETALAAHPCLNTVFFADDSGNFRARRNDGLAPVVEVIKTDHLPDTLVMPFEVAGDRLYRAKIYETTAGNYLFMDCHHLIFDGTSTAVLLGDMNAAYAGAEVEKESYTGFELALDEEKLRNSKAYEEAKNYYDNLLTEVDREMLPPGDVEGQQERAASLTYETQLKLQTIREFCARQKITENAFFHGAFAYVLTKFTGREEAFYATVYNGRNDSRLSRAVAMLVKTFPICLPVQEERGILDFLREAGKQLQSGMDNDIFSFADIAHAHEIRADLLFVYQGEGFVQEKICGEEAEFCQLALDAAKAPLEIHVHGREGQVAFTCEYRSDRYSEEFVKSILDSLAEAAREFLNKETLGEVSLLSREAEAKLDNFNKTEVPYDNSQTVISLFSKAAREHAGRTAIIFNDKKYTYAEVDELSEKIAAYVANKGLGRGDVVSIMIPRSEYMYIASLGVLKAGCAYQPLDITYPAERLKFMVQDASAKLLIATEELRPLLTDYQEEVLFLQDIPALPMPAAPVAAEIVPEDIFILLYTSGSTGTPKGVKLTHKNLVCNINWYRKYYGITPEDCCGEYASYGFDMHMYDTYAAFASGATVAIVPEDIRLDLQAVNAYFEIHHVTHAFITTQVGRQFVENIDNHGLKDVTVAGEKLVTVEPPKNFRLVNGYGPTETTMLLTIFQVEKVMSNIPIGKPLDNVKVYVVDNNRRRVPVGALGELWAAGPQVGAGYLNRPEKTAEVFVANPWDKGEYGRVYRTGDIVRYLPDGNIEFIGRRDGQVKVRGFRIELTEVEAVIREYPGVKDATVAAFDHPGGGKFVAAYVVGDAELDFAAIADFIRERKPPYMVPETFTQLDKIPLNQNSKVNRRALPVPELSVVSEVEEDASRPVNALEKELQQLVGEITGQDHVPLSIPLDRAGVSSIGLIRLAAMLYKRYGFSMPAKKFKGISLLGLENEMLAAWMSGSVSGATSKEPLGELEAGEEEFVPYPLSAAQMGLYMECMKNPESTAYNIPSVLEFSLDTDEDAVAAALERVLAAHPSLNVHFGMVDHNVMTVKNEDREIVVLKLEKTEEECQEFRSKFPRPFLLNKLPLCIFVFVRTEKSLYLFVDFHHLIFDGFSLNLFMQDFTAELEGKTCSRETASYADFVRQQQELLAGEGAGEFDVYFGKLLADYDSPSRITPDLPKSDEPGKAQRVRFAVSQGCVDQVLQRTEVSEAAFFLAVLYYVTARLTSSDQVYISTVSSGRSDARFAETYGMFVNTLPLASRLGDGTVDDYILETARGLEAAVAHEDYPFAWLADKWDYSVEVMYTYQRGVIRQFAGQEGGSRLPKIPGLVFVSAGNLDTPKFPLDIQVIDGEDSPVLEIVYNDALYSAELAENIGRYCCTVLQRFAENGGARLRSISLVDEHERRLLRDFCTVPEARKVPKDTFFFSNMEEFAREYPERTALIATDGTFTYREFDTITDRVANALIKRGAKVGGRVLILLPRTSRALFAFYGASKAGLGYIPFDPTYPAERVNMVIEDSDAQFVITTADMLPRFADKCAIDVEELLLETDETKPRVPLTQEHISYFIYTSGSTGRPKGVMLTHGGMAHYVANMPNKEMVNALRDYCSVYACITTLSFDMSVMGYSLALANGLTVYFANEEECNNADLLAARMMETHADVISDVPSRIYTLIGSEAFKNALRTYGKLVICGGEKYSEKLMNALKEVVPHPMNIYGPSEITISCNEHDMAKEELITVGRPTPGVTEYVVDTDGNELPIGVVGEIYIGGWGVGAGYNNLPELTAEKFISYRGERIYKSGDYGRWRKNGYLEIIGRKDNQIKLRGLRIELDEVETVLAQQPGMRHTAVKIEKINGIEHLCAWFTNEDKVDIPQLKAALGKTLTAYMVPTAYMQMESMPFTPNGKLDLKHLPVPEVFRAGGDAARTQTERDFCEIFSELLNVPEVLATESFFELGGTSLLVTKVVIEAGKRGYNIVFGDVFQKPTPRALAAIFEENTEVPQEERDKEVEDYDYTAINNLLQRNTLEAFKGGKALPLGNVLLTGATGYLGMHILHELLENTEAKVYCLLRAKGGRRAENRLHALCFYYFQNAYRELEGKRLFVIEGDVTDSAAFEGLEDCQIDTVINCAASVKHFAHDSRIEDINVGGARNVIKFCLEKKARMIQTSTMSVLETGYKDNLPNHGQPTEQTLYFGQDLTNKYVHSKFLAERAVLEAVVQQGLSAKIMRYGNLASRASDGEFQINFASNAAMGMLKGYAALGCAAYDQLDRTVEFSPIDAVARATVALSQTPDECRIFHVITDQYIPMVHVFREMRAMGHPVEFVEPEVFAEVFARAQSNPRKAPRLTSLMAYAHGAGDRERVRLSMSREYTLQVLYRLGLAWPVTSWDYLRKFMNVLNGLGFFDEAWD
ncbi:non-ribosomal peptide synthetase [Selenomonas sp. KH1T6]|uniref:non-ribosomal peptide synthetase n=1 Tax=Selenomonas sp. KH1T6 TaxID=3158784 RepID=UPI0008A734D2|nr:amino acid adenylation domain-containing protein/thioester reductase domain-containing protein [Selenomonas ruminantium]